jgi:hypothetical protein
MIAKSNEGNKRAQYRSTLYFIKSVDFYDYVIVPFLVYILEIMF